MISRDEIKAKTTEFNIPPQNVQRDYVFGWMLSGLFSESNTKDQLILKGGNALRKGYYENTRFSKDLDFSVLSSVNQTELLSNINNILKYIHERSGIDFLINKTRVEPKLVIDNKQVYEAKIVFKGFYQEEEADIKIQMDVTEFDKILLPIQSRSLIHPYSDSSQCNATIKCHKVEEILASKLVSLLKRRKAGDIFDLAYTLFKNNDNPVNRLEVLTTFLKKTIYESEPKIPQQQLLGLSMEESRPFWGKIVAPFNILFDFDQAVRYFNQMVNILFGLIPNPAYTPMGYGISTPSHYSGLSYYPNEHRKIIIDAGESLKMLKLLYDGAWRFVEPYALKYNIRKADNRGMEYFWAYDTSGGNSGKIGIKQFVSDNIESIQSTTTSFIPRWPVEL